MIYEPNDHLVFQQGRIFLILFTIEFSVMFDFLYSRGKFNNILHLGHVHTNTVPIGKKIDVVNDQTRR